MTFDLSSVVGNHVRGACALMGPSSAFIDHTAPLCALLDIPLLTKDPEAKFSFEALYPGLRCQIKNWTVESLLRDYSTIFYPFRPTPSFASVISQKRQEEPGNPLWRKTTQFIYHLHGCSDKGYHSDWISPSSHFLDVDKVLFYGKRMMDIFDDNQILSRLRGYEIVGNYRRVYYEKHKNFYQNLIQREIFDAFESEQPTLLYAPSWFDPEGSCSLFKACEPLIDNLPDEYNLILKLHPYLGIKTEEYDPTPLQNLLMRYQNRPNITIVTRLPLVYPILDRIVGYIGDYSSIGYDALSFSLPLFFINHLKRDLKDPGAYLLRCGEVLEVDHLKEFYKGLNTKIQKNSFGEIQKSIYEYAYGQDRSYLETQELLKSLLIHF